MDTEEKRCQWHPACYAALNLEFKENKYDLEFQQEIPINVLPFLLFENENPRNYLIS